jgi:Domain of unknown function (DUF4261)
LNILSVQRNLLTMSIFDRLKKKSENQKEPPVIRNDAETLSVKLLFENTVLPDFRKLQTELKKYHAKFEAAENAEKVMHYFFHDYLVRYDEETLPAQGLVFPVQENKALTQQLAKPYQQAWHWKDAQEQTKNCTYEMVLSELMTLPLDYKSRVDCFQKFLHAACDVLKPKAVYFLKSEKIVETSAYLKQLHSAGMLGLYGLLNVRLFNLPDGEYFMDSVGLHALGLPDLQIRFTILAPTDVAPVLYSLAQYIFENGSVIRNGNTIEGSKPGSRWECVYAQESLEPKRNVLHLNVEP